MTRLEEIKSLLETELTEEEVKVLEEEVRQIMAAQKRQGVLKTIASYDAKDQTSDPFDTNEYKRHFMEFACRGTKIPIEYRKDQVTTTQDASAVIPTTIMNEIIQEAKTYGNIWAGVRRLNIQGGVSFPIMTLTPQAKWITETTPSQTQKLEATQSIMFSYHGLECRIAQTLLASIVTLDEFKRQFVPMAAIAMVKAVEIAIIKGTGSGQMLGVLNDPRVTNHIKLGADITKWEGWKKKVFAKMKKSYRNGIFIMAQSTFDGYIDGMVDTSGQPIGRVNYGIDGGESYRFGGRHIEIVEDDLLPGYEDAAEGEAVAIYMRLSDYAINTNMQMQMVHWTDHDTNTLKNKCIMIIDGKVIDPNGIIVIQK